MFSGQKCYIVKWSSACVCWGVHGTESTPTHPYTRDKNIVKQSFYTTIKHSLMMDQ